MEVEIHIATLGGGRGGGSGRRRRRRRRRYVCRILMEKLEVKIHFEDLDVGGR
jgi:hypothetical protein